MSVVDHPITMAAAGTTLLPTTWNPADKDSECTLSSGNLTASWPAAGYGACRSVFGANAGKYYYEVTLVSGADDAEVGMIDVAGNVVSSGPGDATYGWALIRTGAKMHAGSATAVTSAFANGDVIGLALDLDGGKIWFRKNGAWVGGGNPAAGTGPDFTGLSHILHAAVGDRGATGAVVATANFGATAFAHGAPAGFLAGFGPET